MKDKVSALLDGDLDEQATRVVFDGLRRDPDLRRDWEAYCLIGDVLRGDRDGSDDFVARVMANLDSEPTVLAPRAAPESMTRQRMWQSLMPIAASEWGKKILLQLFAGRHQYLQWAWPRWNAASARRACGAKPPRRWRRATSSAWSR